jgi:hypothetical protein
LIALFQKWRKDSMKFSDSTQTDKNFSGLLRLKRLVAHRVLLLSRHGSAPVYIPAIMSGAVALLYLPDNKWCF